MLQVSSVVVHLLSDLGEAVFSVVDGLHGIDVSQKCLGSADVAGRFVAFDVLFSGLQSHAVTFIVVGVDGFADDSSRHSADVVRLRDYESSMRPSLP